MPLVVDHRRRRAVLRAAGVLGIELVAVRRPGAAVVGHAEDQLGRRHAGRVGLDRVGDVVGGSTDRRDRADRARARRAVVVAHDEDGVGGARGRRGLERVVADVAGRVEGQLVALGDGVELRADALHERDELVGVAGGEGLEVEVHAIGAAVADRDRDVLGERRLGRCCCRGAPSASWSRRTTTRSSARSARRGSCSGGPC